MAAEIDKGCILLRKWKFGDEEDLVKSASDLDVSRFLKNSFPYPYTHKDAHRWIHFVNHVAKGYFMAIEVNKEVVGCIGVEQQEDVFCKSAELGYWIGQKYWNRGIMTHVVKETVDHAFLHMNIVRLYANVFEGNIGSVKVLEKAGFVQEAVLKNAVYKNGNYLDQLIFAIIRR
ncbi:GNAT family N-acetyltransferase [Labilibaculum sp. A4]|uniref:GNAT family N-acetyltransferase n=1 Tax=Labilibaculum euxinus TaxID=2686357 RepID=A0A425Y7A2_9BACT|nr:GNAT family protein [Labilibaculum euxinus]MDQ1771853.1 GNAT family protein [Labilibaculum euxinus]MUP38075.1 GNAT family N-acetyltransferase [Labilibaculum euxinus]MVB07280.1 GNAT family N-acetyltransferase [Labilibaculum euxinus]MWN77757.1 GNAT family N-acetyltransferase [Labilibaculum euxinus]